MLHRPELYEPGQHEGIVEVIIAKQRNGPTGEITLTYLKQFMRFENFAVGTPFDELTALRRRVASAPRDTIALRSEPDGQAWPCASASDTTPTGWRKAGR